MTFVFGLLLLVFVCNIEAEMLKDELRSLLDLLLEKRYPMETLPEKQLLETEDTCIGFEKDAPSFGGFRFFPRELPSYDDLSWTRFTVYIKGSKDAYIILSPTSDLRSDAASTIIVIGKEENQRSGLLCHPNGGEWLEFESPYILSATTATEFYVIFGKSYGGFYLDVGKVGEERPFIYTYGAACGLDDQVKYVGVKSEFGISDEWKYCPPGSPPGLVYTECYEDYKARDYRGTVSKTKSGHDCESWGYDGIYHRYCRNPDSDDQAWCFISGEPWSEYCNVGEPQSTATATITKNVFVV